MEICPAAEPESNGREVSSCRQSNDVDPNICTSDRALTPDDVCLVIGKEEIICHKEVLIEHSSYFRAMFTSSMKESTSERVDMKGLSADSFKCLLHFMNTGKISLSSDSVHGLVEAACMLQVRCCVLVY